MEKFVINGGKSLFGEVKIQSAKNSVLPLIAASVINDGKTYIENCPKISDVLVMMKIIEKLGGKAYFEKDDLVIDGRSIDCWILPCDLTREIRASIFTVGALISRFGYASTCAPGGCNIGDRPIDIHIDALKKLGAIVRENDEIIFDASYGFGGSVTLRFPSVGATENAIMSAVRGKGVCIIKNAAKEPEILDLQRYLNALGANVEGGGTDTVVVRGVEKKISCEGRIKPIPARIEAGTFALAAVACGGEIRFLEESLPKYLFLSEIFRNNACKMYLKNDKIEGVKVTERPKGFGRVIAEPFPGFPTDLQPQLVAASCFAKGLTVVVEKVFPGRFSFVEQLLKTGADLSVCDNACIIDGGKELNPAETYAGDLRGGAALIIAALGIEGKSLIGGTRYVDRGYEKIEEKFRGLGADIRRVEF